MRLGTKKGRSVIETDLGWIMMELLPGVMLETKWVEIPLAEKKLLLDELAMVFAATQRSHLPKGVHAHGGLAIQDGEIVSGQASTVLKGPCDLYADRCCARFFENFGQAKKSPALKGWN